MAFAVSVELVAVRHGMTAWNLERRYQGQRDIPLKFPEAEAALLRLRQGLAGERFERVAFWDSTVNQAEGRRWQLRYQPTQFTDQTDRAIDQAKGAGEWQCSYSSAVPAPPARP